MRPPQPTIQTLPRRFGARWRWLVLLTVMIGTIASIMSSTIINVAVPDLMRHFGIAQAQAQWVSAGFMAAMTLAMLPTPWLLGRFGFRHTYMGVTALLLVGAVVAFVYGMGLFGSTYLVPVFMQTALHFTPSAAGAALLPAGLVLAVVIPVAGRLADRIPPYRLVCAGLALLAASFALMGTVRPGTALAVLMLWAAVGRLGLGLVLPSLSLGSLKGLDGALIPQAVSHINFLRQLGGAICATAMVAAARMRPRAALTATRPRDAG